MGKETNQKCEIRHKNPSKISKNLKRQTGIEKLSIEISKEISKKEQNILGNQNQGKLIISIKLLINSKANKVLFAEVGKDFVDFLFQIMSLPIGTIIRLLNLNEPIVGCLGSLYKSIKTLSAENFQPNLKKDTILNPTLSVNVPLLSINDGAPTDNKVSLYSCDSYEDCNNFTDCFGTVCSLCGFEMSTLLNYVEPNCLRKKVSSYATGTDGYVKELVSYMVMDNLEVKRMSTISGIIDLMNMFHVQDVSDLVEKNVEVGFNEGIAILKASMENNTVFTTVFLPKKLSS